MAKRISPPLTVVVVVLSLTILTSASQQHQQFEGFGDDNEDDLDNSLPIQLTDPITLTQSHPLSSSQPSDLPTQPPPSISTSPSNPSDYWDEDEFEGLPTEITDLPSQQQTISTNSVNANSNANGTSEITDLPLVKLTVYVIVRKFMIEIICVSFLVIFLINYFTGKKDNENLALSWAAKFATKDSIFDKNFSLLGVGDGDDSPLLLKEGQNVFKFYASGRRYCQGLLATMELKSRHDLISRVYNAVVQCKDEISFEVYMNDDAMDQIVFAVARKKLAKAMLKELPDLSRFGSVMNTPSGRKWVSEELSVLSESKEVGADFISEAVLDQVLFVTSFFLWFCGLISICLVI